MSYNTIVFRDRGRRIRRPLDGRQAHVLARRALDGLSLAKTCRYGAARGPGRASFGRDVRCGSSTVRVVVDEPGGIANCLTEDVLYDRPVRELLEDAVAELQHPSRPSD